MGLSRDRESRMSVGILATEATLNTLSVTIKALMVSGKQMTLAVFRQLPSQDSSVVLTHDGYLREDLNYWGRVRYAIKDEGDHWVVLENQGQLYRSHLPDIDSYQHLFSDAKWQLEKALKEADECARDIYSQRESLKGPAEGNHKKYIERWLISLEEKLPGLRDKVSEQRRVYDWHSQFCKNVRESLQVLHGLTQLFIAV